MGQVMVLKWKCLYSYFHIFYNKAIYEDYIFKYGFVFQVALPRALYLGSFYKSHYNMLIRDDFWEYILMVLVNYSIYFMP